MEQKYLCGEAGHTISKMCAGQATKRQAIVCLNQTMKVQWSLKTETSSMYCNAGNIISKTGQAAKMLE